MPLFLLSIYGKKTTFSSSRSTDLSFLTQAYLFLLSIHLFYSLDLLVRWSDEIVTIIVSLDWDFIVLAIHFLLVRDRLIFVANFGCNFMFVRLERCWKSRVYVCFCDGGRLVHDMFMFGASNPIIRWSLAPLFFPSLQNSS